jgi:hypothetical protein
MPQIFTRVRFIFSIIHKRNLNAAGCQLIWRSFTTFKHVKIAKISALQPNIHAACRASILAINIEFNH